MHALELFRVLFKPVKGLRKFCRSKKVQVSRRREAIHGYQVIKKGGGLLELKNKPGRVDGLEVTILVDDYAGYGSDFLGSHGVAILLKVSSGGTVKRILMDVGKFSLPLFNNMALAGVAASDVDMLFLSHCHRDHTWAIDDFLKRADKQMPIVGHPGIFRDNFRLEPFVQNIGMTAKTTKGRISDLGGQLLLTSEAFGLMEGVFSTGEVERVTDFEGKGIGTYNLKEGEMIPDRINDDMSIVINIKGRGLFIVTGCSHVGIVNIVRHSVNITGINKVYGIIGGFHLVNADDETIEKTVHHLQKFNPEIIVPGHCTGHKAQCVISAVFGERYKGMHAGMKLNIDAV